MSSSSRPRLLAYAVPLPGFVLIFAGQPSVGFVTCCVGFIPVHVLYYVDNSHSVWWGLPVAVIGVVASIVLIATFPGGIHWN